MPVPASDWEKDMEKLMTQGTIKEGDRIIKNTENTINNSNIEGNNTNQR